MLDGERVSGKSAKSSKNNNTSNNVFSSSEIEEEDGEFAGPSTSNYKNESTIDDLSHYTEDLDVNEHRNKRELFSDFRRLLDHDSVFHRIRSEILSDLERMAQEQKAMDNKQLSHRQRFEFLERLDDLLDTKNDLNEAHMAILRSAALQLSKHAPLEVMSADFDLEHLFVVPEKRKENHIEEEAVSPPKKTRKSRNVEEPKPSSSTNPVQKVPIIEEPIKPDIQPIIELPKLNEVKEPESNGVPILNGENGKPDIGESPSKLVEPEKSSNKSASIESVEVKNEDPKDLSTTIDPDQESNIDSKETRSSEKAKKVEPKKLIKKPATNSNKPNGISKPVKIEKLPNRRASERQESKASRTPEPESKKPKRRTAAAAIVSAPPEPSIEQSGRQSSQRRTTRNTQPNELSNIDEQTYCLCDQISYGQMVCCDNLKCNIEWYHFDCVGLKVKPGKGQKWYCPTCRGEKSTVMKSNTRR